MAYSIIVITLVILLLVGAWAYPYITGIMLKSRMLKALRMTARASGFRYRRSYKNIFFVRNRSPKYDIVIYNEKKLYAVKLWSSYFAYNTLAITKKGKVSEHRRTRPVFQMTDSNTVYTRGFAHSVPKTRLPRKYAKGRDVERILLVYPSYESIVVESGKGELKLKTGDELFEKLLYSPSAFLKKLKADAPDGKEEEK